MPERAEIREHIVAGRIKEAIAAIESHFPTVLDNAVVPPPSAPEPVTAAGPAVKTIFGDSSARTGPRISASSSSSNLLRPLSGPNPRSPLLRATSAGTNGKPAPAGAISDRPHAMFASLEPSHIALNLQTQAFIEFVRSAGSSSRPDDVPAPSSSSPKRPLTDLANSTGSLEGGDGSPAASMISSASSAVSQKTAHLALSLSYCQALWRRAGELPDPSERVVFLKELESVSALLSYPDPWASPARRYMEQSRRDGLAERVNAAILGPSSPPRPSTP